MSQSQDVIVVSDLHLAAERDKGLFQADTKLSSFFDWVFKTPSTVVLAGDIFDFLVMEPDADLSKAFDLNAIPKRMLSIIEHHEEVFDVLSKLALSPHHKLVLLGGNHDPELVLPEVQHTVEKRLRGAGKNLNLRWLVHGEAAVIHIGAAKAIIEHGDMYDPWNWIDRDTLRRAANFDSRGLLDFATNQADKDRFKYEPPPGSRLVVEFITEQRKRFPWMDILKPEREAVLPILWTFIPKDSNLMKLPDKFLDSYSRERESDLMYKRNPANMVKAAPEMEVLRSRFSRWAEWAKNSLMRTPTEDKIEHLVEHFQTYSGEDGFFDIEIPNEYSDKVEFILNQGADLVVHGHTHSAKAYQLGKGLYLNDGTWGRLMGLPSSKATPEDWRKFIASLQPIDKDSAKREHGFLRPTFVRLTQEDNKTVASLMEWMDAGAQCLSSWDFISGEWQRME